MSDPDPSTAKPRKGLIGVACDTWKVKHFRRALHDAGFRKRIRIEGQYCDGGYIFQVKCQAGSPDFDKLQAAVVAAQTVCEQIKAQRRDAN